MGIPILRVRDENGNVYAIPAIQGAAGAPGADGITPTIGANGNWFLGSTDTGKPSRGVKGEQGEQGPQGKPGAQGEKGDTGEKGEPGAAGAPGADGITPTIGTNGNWFLGSTDTGKPSRGEKGDKGDTGAQGEPGKDGRPGAAGAPGATGTTFTPSVSADGTLSWTNDGGKTNPASVNIKGPQGETGPRGPQGPKGDTGSGFKVLGYYATAAALSAAVENPEAGMAYGVGTAQPYDIYIYDSVSKSWKNNGPLQGAKGDTGVGVANVTFDDDVMTVNLTSGAHYSSGSLRGPQGVKGDAGAKGEKGDPGAQGEKGATGAAGAPGADGITPTIGANGNWFLGSTDTGKPSRGEKGEQGAQGPQGKPGAQGEKGDTGEKGEPGAAGAPGTDGITPTIGTNGNWFLGSTDTGKPSRGEKGDKGDTGAQGEPGKDGRPGSAGAPGATGTTFTPSVSADGTLSWTNDGGKTNPASVNIKGPQGAQGPKGEPGATGPQGPAGHTPVKGTDYWTAADQTSMVNDVLAALPTWSGGAY